MACSRSRMSRSLLVALLALTTGISAQICVIKDCGEECDQMWFQVQRASTRHLLLERRVSSSSPFRVQADVRDCPFPCPPNVTAPCQVSPFAHCQTPFGPRSRSLRTCGSTFAATDVLRSGHAA